VQGVLDTVSVVGAFTAPAVAVIITGVVVPVATVDATKLALLVPLGTVTDWGTLTNTGALSERDTAKPPDNAFLLSVMVQVLGCPPDTVAGTHDNPVKLGGCTMVTIPPLAVVEMALPLGEDD
jgi:hypothetical protein